MSDVEPVAFRVSDGLRHVMQRVGRLALRVAELAALIGIATFATGWWIFDGSRPTWIVIGGIVCFAPCAAALVAWYRLRRTMRVAPALLGDVRRLMTESREAADTLITYDADEHIMSTARTFIPLRGDLRERRHELPALWAGVRAITTLPGLAAIALLGTLGLGALGTILLIGGLID